MGSGELVGSDVVRFTPVPSWRTVPWSIRDKRGEERQHQNLQIPEGN